MIILIKIEKIQKQNETDYTDDLVKFNVCTESHTECEIKTSYLTVRSCLKSFDVGSPVYVGCRTKTCRIFDYLLSY